MNPESIGVLCFPTNFKRYAVHVFQVGRDLRTRRAGSGNYGPSPSRLTQLVYSID